MMRRAEQYMFGGSSLVGRFRRVRCTKREKLAGMITPQEVLLYNAKVRGCLSRSVTRVVCKGDRERKERS